MTRTAGSPAASAPSTLVGDPARWDRCDDDVHSVYAVPLRTGTTRSGSCADLAIPVLQEDPVVVSLLQSQTDAGADQPSSDHEHVRHRLPRQIGAQASRTS